MYWLTSWQAGATAGLILLSATIPNILQSGAEIRVVTFGSTKFAKQESYARYSLSDDARQQYLRDGSVILRGVLTHEALSSLYRSLPDVVREHGFFVNNIWMYSDEVLDFLTYGPFGHIAAQMFRGTDHNDTEVFLWKAFMNSRSDHIRPTWHVDEPECAGDLPSQFMASARIRFVFSLNGGMAEGTVAVNQSAYASSLSENQRQLYRTGQLLRQPLKDICAGRQDCLTPPEDAHDLWGLLPPLSNSNLSKEDIIEHGKLDYGDVIMLNPCIWHRSPQAQEKAPNGGHLLLLQPSFAPGESTSDTTYGSNEGDCIHDLKLGSTLSSRKPDCFPLVHPPFKRRQNDVSVQLSRKKLV